MTPFDINLAKKLNDSIEAADLKQVIEIIEVHKANPNIVLFPVFKLVGFLNPVWIDFSLAFALLKICEENSTQNRQNRLEIFKYLFKKVDLKFKISSSERDAIVDTVYEYPPFKPHKLCISGVQRFWSFLSGTYNQSQELSEALELLKSAGLDVLNQAILEHEALMREVSKPIPAHVLQAHREFRLKYFKQEGGTTDTNTTATPTAPATNANAAASTTPAFTNHLASVVGVTAAPTVDAVAVAEKPATAPPK